MDSIIEKLYGTDIKQGRILSLFTVLAICISCLGLFGLSSLLIGKRAKEISIRKVHGASNPSLVRILLRGFIVWVILANLISWPISWFYMSKWLQQFAYKIKLTYDICAIAALFSIGIAILTVIYESVKTANANPIKGLSTE